MFVKMKAEHRGFEEKLQVRNGGTKERRQEGKKDRSKERRKQRRTEGMKE
jgi:hypothetical protein